MLAEILEMSRVERKHGRMVYNILNQTIDSGVNTDYFDPMEKYYALAQNNKLRIAHYPLYGQLSYSKCFAPKPAAELASPQGGRIRTQKMTFRIFDDLYCDNYDNEWIRLGVGESDYHNRIYLGVY